MRDKIFSGYGATIKKYRAKAGMSQVELASILDVKRNTVVNWETECTQPDFHFLHRLCEEMKIPTTELLQVGPLPVVHEYSKDEKHIVSLYRDLSKSGKELAKKNLLSIKEIEKKAQYNQCKALYFLTERPSTGTANGCRHSVHGRRFNGAVRKAQQFQRTGRCRYHGRRAKHGAGLIIPVTSYM